MKNFIRIFDFFNTIESKIAFIQPCWHFQISGSANDLEQQVFPKNNGRIPPIDGRYGDTALTVLSACLGVLFR